MRHTRRQVDHITVSLQDLSERQRQHAEQQNTLVNKQDQLCNDVRDMKSHVYTLVNERNNKSLSTKAKVAGASLALTGLALLLSLLSGDVSNLLVSLKNFLGVLI